MGEEVIRTASLARGNGAGCVNGSVLDMCNLVGDTLGLHFKGSREVEEEADVALFGSPG